MKSLQAEVTEMKNAQIRDDDDFDEHGGFPSDFTLRDGAITESGEPVEMCPWVLRRAWASVGGLGREGSSPCRGWAPTPRVVAVARGWAPTPRRRPCGFVGVVGSLHRTANQFVQSCQRLHQSLPTDDWCPCCRWIQSARDGLVKNVVVDGDSTRPNMKGLGIPAASRLPVVEGKTLADEVLTRVLGVVDGGSLRTAASQSREMDDATLAVGVSTRAISVMARGSTSSRRTEIVCTGTQRSLEVDCPACAAGVLGSSFLCEDWWFDGVRQERAWHPCDHGLGDSRNDLLVRVRDCSFPEVERKRARIVRHEGKVRTRWLHTLVHSQRNISPVRTAQRGCLTVAP